jgi:error-prone DNA polymerase
VVQWDKDGLEQVGLVKIDLLSLRVLSAISDTIALVEQTTGERIDLPGLTYDDPAVYRMIARGDTVGVFQVESRAQTQMIPRLRPRCFEDLVVAISLIRPGPIQANAVHPYLRRRAGEEPVAYLHPLLQPALESTLGVLLFQEQVLLIARDAAGFTPGQGELLRRALGAKQAGAEVERLRETFLNGAVERGVTPEIAGQIFEQLKAFGSYSFPRSHATAFAVIVYQAAWLKYHHFLPYWTGLLNNQPMGFWSPSVLVGEAKRRGLSILPVDANRSRERCAIEGDSIRLGLNYVKGMGEGHAQRLLAGREQAPYRSLEGFCRLTRLPRRLVEHLIASGAMDGWGVPRRQLLWQLAALRYEAEEPELSLATVEDEVSLPPLSETETLLMEQGVTGVSTGAHILTFYRAWLQARGVLDSEQIKGCPAGRRVRLAGLLVVHQSPPTAKGTHFVTLEDEKGLVDVVVRPRLYQQVRHVLRHPLLLVEGTVQREGAVSVLASSIRRLQQ